MSIYFSKLRIQGNTMKQAILFLFCLCILAGCSQPRHETLIYYYPVIAETTQAPVTAPQTAPAAKANAAAQASQTAVPAQNTTAQAPVNITTLYPAPLPYTGTVTTYSAPAPQTYLFIAPSFGYYHHHYRHLYRRHHYRRHHRGFHPYIGFSGWWW